MIITQEQWQIKKEHIEKENFNKILDWYVEARLNTSKINFMKDNLDDGLGTFTLLNGKTVMFAHGHQDSINTISKILGATVSLTITFIIITREEKHIKVFVNGSTGRRLC